MTSGKKNNIKNYLYNQDLQLQKPKRKRKALDFEAPHIYEFNFKVEPNHNWVGIGKIVGGVNGELLFKCSTCSLMVMGVRRDKYEPVSYIYLSRTDKEASQTCNDRLISSILQ